MYFNTLIQIIVTASDSPDKYNHTANPSSNHKLTITIKIQVLLFSILFIYVVIGILNFIK